MGAFSHLPYRRGVGMMLLNRDKKVFVAKRIDMTSEAWQMPQGGVDDGEDERIAALRELEEETSIRNVEIVGESKEWVRYDLPDELVPKIWGGRYRGQEQKWFVLRFLGEDGDINLRTSHPEFSEWQWAESYHLPSLIVPFKRDLYTQLLVEFRPYL